MKLNSRKRVIVYLAVLAAAYLVFNLAAGSCAFLNTSSPSTDSEPGAGTTSNHQSDIRYAAGVISVEDLPKEGRTTLQLIKSGGPFPYSKDGAVFSNYEGILPKKSSGYYHEYTVITPGSPDRGARRIIAGENGEYYYTDDHYGSFKLIQE